MNKIAMKSILVMFCLFLGVNVFSQSTKWIKNVIVKASVVQDPSITARTASFKKTKRNLQWIQIDVDYTTVPMMNKITKSTAWKPLVMKYSMLLPKVSGKPYVILTGKVEYWGVAMDGKVHYAQSFVHPKILQRYVPGIKLNGRRIKDIRIIVEFEVNESNVGVGFCKPKNSSTYKQINGEIQKALSKPSTLKVKGSIFSRNETPWGVINLDPYELIKLKKSN